VLVLAEDDPGFAGDVGGSEREGEAAHLLGATQGVDEVVFDVGRVDVPRPGAGAEVAG
jgi:hypothetical protein